MMAETPKPSKPKTTVKSKSATSASNHHEYLKSRYYTDETKTLEKTNTRIGNKDLKIAGGTYHIPDKEYDHYLSNVYHPAVIRDRIPEYLTEKQLESGGVIAVDLDLRHDASVTQRQYTPDHVEQLVCAYLETLKTMYQMDETTPFQVFIFEKETVNRVEKDGAPSVTKDGIHMLITIQADRVVQTILRQRILARMDELWGDVPLTNTWNDVFDEGISKGTTNWQLYGSTKPGNPPYRLSRVFQIGVDPGDGEITMDEVSDVAQYLTPEQLPKLSVRYRKHTVLYMTNAFLAEYQTVSGVGGAGGGARPKPVSSSLVGSSLGTTTPHLQIKTQDQLTEATQYFLESLSPEEYDLREAHEYTMELPVEYYGPGSFSKWIRVGWVLNNISSRLFLTWLAMSAQSPKFHFVVDVPDLWTRWQGFDTQVEHSLTKRSLMYWVRHDNPTGFAKIQDTSLEYLIEQTLERCTSLTNNSTSKRLPKGSGDYDIAVILWHMFRDEYKCVSVKANIWYQFEKHKHKWTEIDSGTTLRRAISEDLRRAYTKKNIQLNRQRKALMDHLESQPENAQKLKALEQRLDAISDIMSRLSRTNDKKNIMVEAKELFFDPYFLLKLDEDPYLMCFNNGVVDFRTKSFRPGKPEDYISKTTNIDYVHIDPGVHGSIVDEIEDFMHKLFPNPELYGYMWEHLASALVGNGLNQTFNMYIGVGQNGKSVLVNLMEQTLGEYKGDVPLTLITQQRTKIGGLAPELVQLKGVRYAVMQEPSKGDRINEGIMKQITGGDPIQARAPYMPQIISYIPQFKLVVCSNEFMEIKSQDHGTWRRIRVVDFESLFTDNPKKDDPVKPHQFKLDKSIKEKFGKWREVFASMLVEIAYRTNGAVEDVARVIAASDAYRRREDYLAEYMDERIEEDSAGILQKNQLTQDFRDWYMVTHGGKGPTKDIIGYLDKRFGACRNSTWSGVRFKDTSGNLFAEATEGGEHHSTLVQDLDLEEI